MPRWLFNMHNSLGLRVLILYMLMGPTNFNDSCTTFYRGLNFDLFKLSSNPSDDFQNLTLDLQHVPKILITSLSAFSSLF